MPAVYAAKRNRPRKCNYMGLQAAVTKRFWRPPWPATNSTSGAKLSITEFDDASMTSNPIRIQLQSVSDACRTTAVACWSYMSLLTGIYMR